MQECLCHSHLPYKSCCERFHQGKIPLHAVELMRSRYCAYALGLVEYIIQTTHQSHPDHQKKQALWKKELQSFCSHTRFQGLEIIHSHEEDASATVAFIAHLLQNHSPFDLIEKSFFKKEHQRWLYVKGVLFPTQEELISALAL